MKKLTILLISIVAITTLSAPIVAKAGIFEDFNAAREACNGNTECEFNAAAAADTALAAENAAAAEAAAAATTVEPALDETLTVDNVDDVIKEEDKGDLDSTEEDAAAAQDNLNSLQESTTDATADAGADTADTPPAEDATSAPPASVNNDSTILDSFKVTDYLTVPDKQEQTYLTNNSENSPLIQFLLLIIRFLSQLIGTISMVLIIIGGLLMVASEGDDNRIQKGKTIILQAIIGLILALSSYILVTFVQSLLYVST